MSKSPASKESPLLCLHGFGVRSWFFDPFVQLFASERVVHAPDLYERTILGRVRQGGEALKQLEEISRKQAIVVGHSLGGVVGAILASKNPQTIAGLILISTPFDGRQGSRLFLGLQKFLIKRDLIPDRIAMSWFFSDVTPRETQISFFKKIVPEPPTLIDETFLPILPHSTILPSIKIPTLCIGSRDDKVVSVSQMEKVAKAIPNAELWLTEKLNHSEILHGPPSATSHVYGRIRAFTCACSK